MRALPATVDPFPGETLQSLYLRLVKRNALTTGELWTAIRKTQQGLPLRTTPELVPRLVEQLAGLSHGWFDSDDIERRLFIRCIHSGWRYSRCRECAPLPTPLTMCRRCTAGARVESQSRSGAFCGRHSRWHYGGRDDEIVLASRFLRAERCLTGPLWSRGIGLDTGELELACELLSIDRELTGGHVAANDAAERLHDFYPEAVQLTAFLTEPAAQAFLSNTHIGYLPVVALIEASVAAIESRSPSVLRDIREAFQTSGRDARVHAAASAVRHGRSIEVGGLGARIRGSGPRLRAVFLRHSDARRPTTSLRKRSTLRR